MSSTASFPLPNLLGTLRSRWYRLRQMSIPEIGYRFYKRCHFQIDKWQVDYSKRKFADNNITKSLQLKGFKLGKALSWQSLHSYLENVVAPRFYFNPAEQHEYVQLVKQRFPQWIERAKVDADKICQHRFQLLGLPEIQLEAKIDWQRDPQTGRSWPQKHWSEISFNVPQAAGDPKLIWELNRHQHLTQLGLAYYYTQDEQYVSEYLAQIESWIAQNPVQVGINWASSLEIAFRVINWFWVLMFCLKSPQMRNERLLHITKSLVEHLEAIWHNPSIYNSPNTHLVGEAFALYLGSILLAEHRSAAQWHKFGLQVLTKEFHKQFFKDGAHKEQSAYYHCYMVEFYLLTVILAQRNQESGIFDELLLVRACEYLMHICQPGGELTAFGDEDGGKVLMLGINSYRKPADLMSTAAVNYRHHDFKYCAGEYQEATLWLMGLKSADIFAGISDRPRQRTGFSFNHAGHVALRADWSLTANYLLFHCPAQTYLPGHTHADCLSFELASGGQSRLIDSGTYKYNGNATIRNHYRGTSAHNTVRIDQQDQSIPGGEFKWQQQAQAHLLDTIFSPVADYVAGEHNGYLALPNPCLHRRAVLFAKPDYFVIWDEFTGQGEHYYESFFHCGDAQIADLTKESCQVSYKDGLQLLIVPITSRPALFDSLPLSENATSGWHSSTYGQSEPGLSLKLHWQANTPTTSLAILFPYYHKAPQIEIVSLGKPNAFAARICTAEYEDIIIFSLVKESFNQVFGQLNFVGERLFLRITATVCRVLAINANLIEYNNQTILDTPIPLSQLISSFTNSGTTTSSRKR